MSPNNGIEGTVCKRRKNSRRFHPALNAERKRLKTVTLTREYKTIMNDWIS
jgi:hypothetical protein